MIGFLFLVHSSLAQPGTEIYLFDLKIKSDKITIDHGRNITNRKGYDNQPFFHPDKQIIYYTSADSTGRTDIVEYNYKSKNTRKFTQTHDKEYSPTVTLDKQFISCIIQRDGGEQDLGKYPIDGGEPKILINNLIVGYHAWANEHTIAIFTLPAPFKLHLLDVTTQKDTIVAENIGRSLHTIPGENAISFVQKITEKEWVVNRIDAQTFKTTLLAKNLPGSDYCMAWTPNGKIVMSDGKKLFFFQPGKGLEWREVQMDQRLALTNLSRIAISQDGKFLALVVSE
jgi:hypothetical protein